MRLWATRANERSDKPLPDSSQVLLGAEKLASWWPGHRLPVTKLKHEAEYSRNGQLKNWCYTFDLIWSPSCAPSSSAWIFLSFSIKIFLLFNTGLRFSSGFLSYSFVQIIFAVLFRAPNHQFVDKKKYTEFSFGAFTSEIRFRTDVGCLNQHRGQRSAHVRTL